MQALRLRLRKKMCGSDVTSPPPPPHPTGKPEIQAPGNGNRATKLASRFCATRRSVFGAMSKTRPLTQLEAPRFQDYGVLGFRVYFAYALLQENMAIAMDSASFTGASTSLLDWYVVDSHRRRVERHVNATASQFPNSASQGFSVGWRQ